VLFDLGLRFLAGHDGVGHEAYLLGRIAERGFIAFYPVALAVKTPLPFLVLLLLAVPIVTRPRPGHWQALAAALAALGILAVSLRSHVNLGIRHVFVLLPLFAVAIARAADEHLREPTSEPPRRPTRRHAAIAVVATLLLAQAGTAIAARRTGLGSFNLLAGRDPAKVLVDSDLDWGQDLYELRRVAHAHGAGALKLAYFGMQIRACQHGLPPLTALLPNHPTTGWVAISENYYRNRSTFQLLKDPCNPRSTYKEGEVPLASFSWLGAYTPVAIAGTSIRLYFIPSPDAR